METQVILTPIVLYSIIASLFSIVLILIGIVWNISVREKMGKLEKEIENLKPRVQSIEDNHGNGLKRLEEKIEAVNSGLMEKLAEVKDMVHKDKNMELQLNTTLGLLLKELQKKGDS